MYGTCCVERKFGGCHTENTPVKPRSFVVRPAVQKTMFGIKNTHIHFVRIHLVSSQDTTVKLVRGRFFLCKPGRRAEGRWWKLSAAVKRGVRKGGRAGEGGGCTR